MVKTIEQIQKELCAPIPADNLQIRIGGGGTYLVYKDARVDFERLNAVVGVFGWRRKHDFIDGKNYCTVEIKNPETGEWVSKQDVGTESKTEADKGQASDAFKRACFNWGIGLELYELPKITFGGAKPDVRKLKISVAYFNNNHRVCACLVVSDSINGQVYFKYVHSDYKKEDVFVP